MDPRSRILVVDDHWRNVAILIKLFGRDHRVATATNGEEALRVAPRFAPDLALLDIMMPGIDGYEVCRRFRAHPSLAHTKIIMVSAKGMVNERLSGYEAGADDYVVKPFDPEELLAKAKVYLRLRSVEEVDRLKTDVLMLFNHETRTPITTILSPLELLLEDPSLNSGQRTLIEMAQESATRVHEMVEKVAFLGRLHADHVEFQMARTALAGPVRDACEAARPLARSLGVDIVEQVDEAVEVEGDGALLARALGALVDNAVRHGACPGSVEVRAEAQEGVALVTVTDHGPGIPPEFMRQVFDGFVVPDIDKHSRGHGLGLATARAIVRRHDGVLAVENAAGGGAVFTVQLPVAGAAAAPGADSAPARAA
jgi:two-component system, sensor histidine kinase and response regulator